MVSVVNYMKNEKKEKTALCKAKHMRGSMFNVTAY